MGSELQGKYQKLAQEYAKLRSHVDILKKAVKDEKAQRTSLEESLRERTLSLRKHVQENESLEFRNQQLSKRVAFLQEEASSPIKNKKKKSPSDGYGFPSGVSEVHTQELAAKISENERLHMKLLEVTQRSERKVSGMESKIVKLEQEVSTHLAAVDEINREHELQVETIRAEKAMLEAKLMAQSSELDTLRKAMEKHLMVAKEEQQNISASNGPQRVSLLEPNSSLSYDALNVPVVDTKLQAEVLKVLVGGVELLTTFTTQMSTFHSYLEQRCKAYPVDTATGHPMSVVNQKLCELLHSSSSFTKPLVSTLTFYHKKLESNPYPQTGCSDLRDFASTHHKFVVYLETITPYLQLSLQEECSESVCGPQLTERNLQLNQAFPCLTGAFTSLNSYLSLAIGGFSGCVHPGNMAVCLENLQQSIKDIQHSLNEILGHFSSKIAQEYQLPTASQKLNTTNECIASSLTGLHATVEQFGGFLESNSELFSAALEQNSLAAESKQSAGSSVVQRLRVRASDYIRRVKKECPESVPYTLAIYNARCLSSSSESRDTLMKQVMANQEKLSRLEQEKEQLILDVQLLRVKHEKEQKKVASMDAELAQLRGHPYPSTPMSAQTSLNTSRSSLASNPPQLRSISESMGSLNTLSDGNEEEPSDDAVREELIRKHFATRIAELSGQLQDGDSKAAHYYAECRTLHKQLNHSVVLRNKMAQDLQISTESIQQLQDQLTTTSSNYERQLSAMSDHLCELNDKLLKQSDEMEILRKSKGKRWGKNKE